jgi:Arf/Sar family protein
MGGLLAKLRSLFSRQMEIVIIGLEHSGKTTFLNQLSVGEALQTVPTIGLNVRTVQKGSLAMKVWDLGGQVQYRSEWPRYTKGTGVVVFVLDTSAVDLVSLARKELHLLLEDRELHGIPILILANKIDLEPHLTEPEIIQGLNLDYIMDNPWVIISISALRGTNIERVVEWLIARSR